MPIIKLNKKFSVRTIDGEALIMDMHTGNGITLNSTATLILENILAGKLPENIAQELSEAYKVEINATLLDVNELIKTLKDQEILISVDS